MADYSQTPPRPNINPSSTNPSSMSDLPPRQLEPAPTGWGMIPALGAVAVVGIVALVAWNMMGNDSTNDTVIISPDAAPATASQPAIDPVPAADPVPAEPAVTPIPATPAPDVQPEPVQPEPVPQEVPAPAPEAAPVPTPTPAPAPTN